MRDSAQKRKHIDPSRQIAPMQPMPVVGTSRGVAPRLQNFAQRRTQAMLICSAFALLVMVLVVFVNTPIVSTLLRMDLERTSLRAAREADSAIARATAIRQRPTDDVENIQDDLQVLSDLVRVEKVVDAAFQKGTALALRESNNPATVHVNAELQRELLKEKNELEGAIVAVTLAVEGDAAAQEGHPLHLDSTGRPLGRGGRIADLADRLLKSANRQDIILARTEADAEHVAQEPARDPSAAAVANELDSTIKTVAQLQVEQEDVVREISAVLHGARSR